ncbi:MAG: tetratricopeptide repeat protein [Pseudomonadota bacterium]
MKILILICIFSLLACAPSKHAVYPTAPPKAGMKQFEQGLSWYTKGCYQTALSHLIRAHELFSASDSPVWVAICLNRIGSVLNGMGDNEQAIIYFNEACQLYQALEKTEECASAKSNKIGVLIEMNRFHEAKKELKELEKSDLKEKHPLVWITVQNNKGVLLTKTKNFKEAEVVLTECARMIKQDDCRQAASVHCALGNLMIETKRPESAIGHFNIALECDRNRELHEGIADDLFYTGIAYTAFKKPAKAIDYWKRSAKIYAQLGRVNDANNVMEHLRCYASQEKGVDLTLTEAFVKAWIEGKLYEKPCEE